MPLNCPIDAEETAEQYAMGSLSGEDLERYGQHLLACPRCTELVRQDRDFIEALKLASRDLKDPSDAHEESSPPIAAASSTPAKKMA